MKTAIVAMAVCVACLMQGGKPERPEPTPTVPAAPARNVPEPRTREEMEAALRAEGVAFARLFSYVAVVETGWDFREGVGALNNPFGMRCSGRRKVCGCSGHGYAQYETRADAVRDLAEWVRADPPAEGEAGMAFLARRGWNPFEGYYGYVRAVMEG